VFHVRLLAGDPAAGPGQPHHLGHHILGVRDGRQQHTGMDEIERVSGQAGLARIRRDDLHARER
jgi:hypothetical protein